MGEETSMTVWWRMAEAGWQKITKFTCTTCIQHQLGGDPIKVSESGTTQKLGTASYLTSVATMAVSVTVSTLQERDIHTATQTPNHSICCTMQPVCSCVAKITCVKELQLLILLFKHTLSEQYSGRHIYRCHEQVPPASWKKATCETNAQYCV